jgi:hypothetical protein
MVNSPARGGGVLGANGAPQGPLMLEQSLPR